MSEEVVTPPEETKTEEVEPVDYKKQFDDILEKFKEQSQQIEDLRKMNESLANSNAALSRMIPANAPPANDNPPYAIPTYEELGKYSDEERYKFCRKYAQDCINGVI